MTDADLLRSLISPLTVRAVRAGADALDAIDRLDAPAQDLSTTPSFETVEV